jgi:predicted DCC family thiol-disulfide oxidoreductase YuxK
MKKLTIFYDNYCPNCTKFSKLVQQLDWLRLIEIKQLRNELHTNSFSELNLELAKQQMASFGTKWHYGYNSLYFTFARLPLLWLLIPFLYILKLTRLGQLLYKELALKRKIIPIHCDTESCDI